MIYIITTHYKTQKWFHLQKRYIEKYTTGPYRILCGAYNVHLPKGCKNYNIGDISDSPDSHYIQVNFLADQVLLPQIEDDDIFLFLDCDAFPCHEGWDLEIKKYLESHDIVAVYRKEDVGMDEDYENIPHLCFFATTKKTWIENKLQWSLGFKEKEFDIDGKKHKRYIPKFENPQVGMKERIENASLNVKELNRTNAFNAHRVCFGVYGDLIYHHCCAIRGFENKVWEGADFYVRKNNGLPFNEEQSYEAQYPAIFRVNAEIWNSIWKAINEDTDCTFVRQYFMGKK